MAISKKPSDSVLNAINADFSYDPVSGLLYKFFSVMGIWSPVGNYHRDGILQIRINNTQLKVANVCWFIHYKEWPSLEIDHKDRDGTNNKIDNLRLVSRSDNAKNRDVRRSNKYHGVTKARKKWRYNFKIDGVLYQVYSFDTDLEAAKAREKHLDKLGDIFCVRNKNLE